MFLPAFAEATVIDALDILCNIVVITKSKALKYNN